MRLHCIPNAVMMLHEFYSKTEQYEKALKIADYVADERWKLYVSFTQERLQDLLRCFRDSKIKLLLLNERDNTQ
jgi:hypothetical protein